MLYARRMHVADERPRSEAGDFPSRQPLNFIDHMRNILRLEDGHALKSMHSRVSRTKRGQATSSRNANLASGGSQYLVRESTLGADDPNHSPEPSYIDDCHKGDVEGEDAQHSAEPDHSSDPVESPAQESEMPPTDPLASSEPLKAVGFTASNGAPQTTAMPMPMNFGTDPTAEPQGSPDAPYESNAAVTWAWDMHERPTAEPASAEHSAMPEETIES